MGNKERLDAIRRVSQATLQFFAAVWRTIVRKANWKSSKDVKETFPNSDMVGDKAVFNIARNRYRLIAFIGFGGRRVFIKAILTHREYDKGRWKR